MKIKCRMHPLKDFSKTLVLLFSCKQNYGTLSQPQQQKITKSIKIGTLMVKFILIENIFIINYLIYFY